jgi:hypothetical protein
MHTFCLKKQQSFNIRKVLHISVLTGPSSGSVQLRKTIVTTFCLHEYVELSHVRQCINYRNGYVHSKCSSLYSRTYWKWQKDLTIVLGNCTLSDDGPVKHETCNGLRIVKVYCNFNEVCALFWLTQLTAICSFQSITDIGFVSACLFFFRSRWPLDCWKIGFESQWKHECTTVVFAVCCVGSGLYNEPITRSETS